MAKDKKSKKIMSDDMKGYIFLVGIPLVLAVLFWEEIKPYVFLFGIPLAIALFLKWIDRND